MDTENRKLSKQKYESVRKQVNFRLSMREYDKLVEKSKDSDMSLTEFCRHAVLTKKAKHILLSKEDTAKILGNHGKIGSNINQLAKSVNSGQLQLTETDKAMLERIAVLERDVVAILFGDKPSNMVAEDQSKAKPSAPCCPGCGKPLERNVSQKSGRAWYRCTNEDCAE